MKSETKLIIDPRDQKATKVTLLHRGRTYSKSAGDASAHSEMILPFIDELLREAQCKLQDMTDIEVLVDTGSFTGRRVGAAIAQTLGLLLRIPVNGQDAATPIDIPYGKDKWS